jgi:hypothetical protein
MWIILELLDVSVMGVLEDVYFVWFLVYKCSNEASPLESRKHSVFGVELAVGVANQSNCAFDTEPALI